MEKSLLPTSRPKIVSPENPNEYFLSTSKRRWELSYGGKDKIYLSEEEKEFFTKAILEGKKMVKMGDLFLSSMFRYLIPVKPKIDPETEERIRITKEKLAKHG
jgi:hypothetical protein